MSDTPNEPRSCEDCGEELPAGRNRRTCAHCGMKVCGWCMHHVHLVAQHTAKLRTCAARACEQAATEERQTERGRVAYCGVHAKAFDALVTTLSKQVQP